VWRRRQWIQVSNADLGHRDLVTRYPMRDGKIYATIAQMIEIRISRAGRHHRLAIGSAGSLKAARKVTVALYRLGWQLL